MAANRHGAGCAVARLPGGEARAGAAPDLPGAGDALAVGGTQARRPCRIDFGETRVQRGGPDLLQQQRAPPPAPPARDRGSPPSPRSARRNTARCRRSGSAAAVRACGRPLRPARPRATRRRCQASAAGADAVERVRHPRFVLRRGARGQHTQLAINLHRVGIDDRCRGNARPIASASADFPLAVGPATITASGVNPVRRQLTRQAAQTLAAIPIASTSAPPAVINSIICSGEGEGDHKIASHHVSCRPRIALLSLLIRARIVNGPCGSRLPPCSARSRARLLAADLSNCLADRARATSIARKNACSAPFASPREASRISPNARSASARDQRSPV